MRRPTPAVALILYVLASSLLFSQSAPLTVVNSGPTGEIAQLQDANEIRVIFSEPMVALGRIPSNPTPPWIRIAPAIAGTYPLVGHDDPDLHAGSGDAAAVLDALHA